MFLVAAVTGVKSQICQPSPVSLTLLVRPGAHTIGRAKPSRSGFGKENTSYTINGPGNPGGSSWTKDWLKFDNSYFKVSSNPCILFIRADI